MIADTDEELHAMADRIGVQRRWWQAPPRHDSHYDIALSKRALAVSYGAIQITRRQTASMCLRRRFTGELGDPDSSLEWARAHFARAHQDPPHADDSQRTFQAP